MRARRRWIGALLGVALALLVAGYAGASYLAYDQLTGAALHCDNRFPDDTPAAFGTKGILEEFTAGGFATTAYAMPGYQEVSFPSRDSRQPALNLHAWWIPATTAGAAAVIVAHGRNSCRHDPVALLPAGMLHRNGFSVLMVDLRNQGDSDVENGRLAYGTKEYRDILGAWDWLRSAQSLPASRIGLMGESLGASSAIIAMAEEPGIAATWEDSGFSEVRLLLDEGLARAGLPTLLDGAVFLWAKILSNDDLASRSPLAAVQKLGARPLAIVHGLADADVYAHHARDLAAAHAKFVPGYEPWLVPRAVHLQAAFAEPQEYERRIVEFFRTNLGA